MMLTSRIHAGLWLMMSVGLLTAAGCKTYEIDVALQPDGGGSRTVTLQIEKNQENSDYIPPDTVCALFSLDVAKGWEPLHDEQGTLTGYQRRVQVADAAAWHRQGGDVRILGNLDGQSSVPVHFTSSITVETGQDATGRSITYRESFTWEGVKQVIIDFVAERFRKDMTRQFLSAAAQTELRGLMAGHLAMIWPRLVDSDDSEAELQSLIHSLTPYAEGVVRRERPQADLSPIAGVVNAAGEDDDNQLEAFITEKYPGIDQGFSTNIELRVEMPGRIIDSNADSTDGAAAVWEFSPTDVLKGPADIYVRSLVAD
jgi:hypothetical protein